MIGGKRILAVQERELRQPPSPVRLYRRDGQTGELRLIDPDWRPPEKAKKSGKAKYRDGMLGRSSRSCFDSPEGDF
jgi:hypothetical protein